MTNKELVEFCFKYEKAIRLAIYEAKNDNGGHTGGGNGHAMVSDPTAMEGIRHVDEIKYVSIEHGLLVAGRREVFKLHNPEKWLKVVAATKEHYKNGVQAQILEKHFMKDETVKDICDSIGIGRTYYFAMVNDILTFATAYAMGLGIIFHKYFTR